jgi:S1-C subfamily serine protease
LIIDYPSQQLFISPNHNYPKADYVNVFGATLLPHTQGVYIDSIRPHGKALQVGLQERDVIVSVEGEQITYQNFDSLDEQLAKFTSVNEICYLRNGIQQCISVEH